MVTNMRSLAVTVMGGHAPKIIKGVVPRVLTTIFPFYKFFRMR
ncbi:hypothetical protein SAMN05216357_1334 [Porphyromonadaceae bacterium KH3CP3RA]|nr:hypothetical protein SAMN05216357_1334 [Porphyromonadaceae bacterium KH3CP3RA]